MNLAPGRSRGRRTTRGRRLSAGAAAGSALAVTLLVTALALAACGGDLNEGPIKLTNKVLGFPGFATKNTTRVSGEDPVADAAAVASAVYPALSKRQRPQVVTLVDKNDWRAGLAAAALVAAPLRAPILLTDGEDLPGLTSDTLKSLQPSGTAVAHRAQAVKVGGAGAPDDLRTVTIARKDPFELAAAVDAFRSRSAGQPSRNVVLAAAGAPRFAMPAAAWAAKSGDAVLLTRKNTVPKATRKAIVRHKHPGIYVLGPSSVISRAVLEKLKRLGSVTRVAGKTPVENAIAFARFSDGSFGWGVRDPGHGLVIANSSRLLDAAAAAPLSASGTYGPLLLTDSAERLPAALERYLLDIQPGYRVDPVRGVYNHAWLMGDESAISVAVQARVDELTEILRVRRGPAR